MTRFKSKIIFVLIFLTPVIFSSQANDEKQIKVIKIKYGDAEEIVKSLIHVTKEEEPKGTVKVAVDEKTNSLIVSGNDEAIKTQVENVISKLDVPTPKVDVQILSLLFEPGESNFEFPSSNNEDSKNLLSTFSSKSISQKVDELKQKGKVETIGTFNMFTSENEETGKDIKVKNLVTPDSEKLSFNDIVISTRFTTKIKSKETMIFTLSQSSTLNLKDEPLKTTLNTRFQFIDNQTLMFYSPVYHSDKKDEKGETIKVYLITLINPHVIY